MLSNIGRRGVTGKGVVVGDEVKTIVLGLELERDKCQGLCTWLDTRYSILDIRRALSMWPRGLRTNRRSFCAPQTLKETFGNP